MSPQRVNHDAATLQIQLGLAMDMAKDAIAQRDDALGLLAEADAALVWIGLHSYRPEIRRAIEQARARQAARASKPESGGGG